MEFLNLLVSGAPAKTYGMAGSLFEFHERVMNADRAALAGVHCLFELYAAAYYRHTAMPDMMVDHAHPWSAELLEKYNAERHCHAAASMVLRIDDAIVQKAVVYCRGDDVNYILYESFRFPDRAVNTLSQDLLEEVPVAHFQQPGRDYLYLGSSGSFNYGHWLVDDLPRAKAWRELRQRLGVVCVFVLPSYGSKMDEVRVRSLQMLVDPLVEVQFIAPDKPCRIENLYYVTPVTFHPRIKNPGAIHFVRSAAAACLPSALDEPTRKLFVARRPPNSRSIVNFDEVWGFLAARGFELVVAEELDFAGQVALFQQARIVVGQMGAAMTGTLFCRPGTSLIYLAPIGWAEPFYLDLAAVGGQQYNVLAGPVTSDGPPYLSDFVAPVDHLYHRLNYMGVDESDA